VRFLVRLVPNSSRHLSRKKRKGMSSSDSMSLSSSSSESIEFGRSRGRHVEEESTSSRGYGRRNPYGNGEGGPRRPPRGVGGE